MAIPSISEPGFPEHTRATIMEAHDAVVELLGDAGVQDIGAIDLPETAPVITGEIPAPEGAPTVLLYSHYDVVPVGDESKWESPPFEASERDGAIYGRGAADTKSNILMHVGALRAWNGRPPVGIKIVIEGQEEVGSVLTTFPPTHPELFAADAMVIGDMGSVRPGVPTLTIGLRGMAGVIVSARTLAGPKHSGQFGGAAPDALLALIRALSTLHDDNGDVAVAGLQARGVDGCLLQRRRVPSARGGRGRRAVHRHRRSGRADLVRPGTHRDRARCPARRCARERGCSLCTRQDQRALPPGAGSARGPGGPRRATSRLRDPSGSRSRSSRPRPAPASSPRRRARLTRPRGPHSRAPGGVTRC